MLCESLSLFADLPGICDNFNTLRLSDAYMRQWFMSLLVQTTACRLSGILLIKPLGIIFIEILIEIHTFSFRKMHFEMSSGEYPPSSLGLNVLTHSFAALSLRQILRSDITAYFSPCGETHQKDWHKPSSFGAKFVHNVAGRLNITVLSGEWFCHIF